jgi:hypothetical protein
VKLPDFAYHRPGTVAGALDLLGELGDDAKVLAGGQSLLPVGGMIGSPAAITNAIEDALGHLGAQVREQHLPPSRILELAGVTQPD